MAYNQDKIQQTVQYMMCITEKLSKTFKELNEMSAEFLKKITEAQKPQKGKTKNKQKQRGEDLNDNLINDEDEEINGLSNKKKIKVKGRIQEAEEDMEEQYEIEKQPPKSAKKAEQDKQKNAEQEKDKQKNEQIKKKPKIVSHKPKAPTSSFLLFFKQQQPQIAKSYPNYGVVELTKVAAKCWNDLSAQDKEPYQRLFQVQRKKYQDEMEKYRREFPEQVKQKELEKKEKKKKKAKERRERESSNKEKKEKGIPIISTNDPSMYHVVTPLGEVKLEERLADDDLNDQYPEDGLDIKNEQSPGSMGEESPQDDASEENSLGEDI